METLSAYFPGLHPGPEGCKAQTQMSLPFSLGGAMDYLCSHALGGPEPRLRCRNPSFADPPLPLENVKSQSLSQEPAGHHNPSSDKTQLCLFLCLFFVVVV